MKRKEVLRLLKITPPTLTKYIKEGKIKVTILGNERYDYDEGSVYNFLNKDIQRQTVIYARVSTPKQKKDLENQIELLKSFCFQTGRRIDAIYSDIASGISFDKRDDFFVMLDQILSNRIKEVIVSYKDRLSRVGFELFKYLFSKFGTKIVVISEVGSEKLDSREIFEEIVNLLHCYSMKLYSSRKRKKIEELCKVE